MSHGRSKDFYVSELTFFQEELKKTKEKQKNLYNQVLKQVLSDIYNVVENNYKGPIKTTIDTLIGNAFMIIKKGADPKVQEPQSGHTLLHLLARATILDNNSDKMHQIIKENVENETLDVDIKNRDGKTALQDCLEDNRLHTAVKLAELGSDLRVTNSMGDSLASLLERNHSDSLINELDDFLKKEIRDIEVRDNQLNYPRFEP